MALCALAEHGVPGSRWVLYLFVAQNVPGIPVVFLPNKKYCSTLRYITVSSFARKRVPYHDAGAVYCVRLQLTRCTQCSTVTYRGESQSDRSKRLFLLCGLRHNSTPGHPNNVVVVQGLSLKCAAERKCSQQRPAVEMHSTNTIGMSVMCIWN